MLTIKKIILPAFDANNALWVKFYEIFCRTLKPDLNFRVFEAYFYASQPSCIDVSFIYFDKDLVGFIEASFYRKILGGKRITVGRGAAGILPNRGAKLPSFGLCAKYIDYKMTHPFEEIYITGYMANPILYAMMCNYTHRVYPKVGISPSFKLLGLKYEILRSNNLLKSLKDEHLVALHFQVQLHPSHVERIEASRNDTHIGYYLSINPNFGGKYGLFTLVPLDWLNIMSSIVKGTFYATKQLVKNGFSMPKLQKKQLLPS